MKKHHNREAPPEIRAEIDGQGLGETWRLLALATPDPVDPVETDRAWEALATRLGLDPAASGSDEDPRFRHRSARPWWKSGPIVLRMAAAAVLALGATAAWYAVPVTHSAPAGEQLAISLPDGSRVELNAGSTLRHRRGFAWLPGLSADSRTVALRGEAFFDVTPGVRPFRVEAGPAAVRVLGTRFNVRARSGAGADARVEVEEGRVEVWSRDSSTPTSVILSAGEAARVSFATGRPVREVVMPERIASWRRGGLAMVDVPLSAVLRELGIRYGIEVSLVDPQAGTTTLSVYYPALGPVESVLSDLATQQNLQYRRTNNGWELF